MAAHKSLLLSLLVLLLILTTTSFKQTPNLDKQDLSFLYESDDQKDAESYHNSSTYHDNEKYNDLDDFVEGEGEYINSEPVAEAEIDESGVVVLMTSNFNEFVKKNRFVIVEVYATWCGHCQALKPGYVVAAAELKAEKVVLAKVDAGEESELSQKYNVEGYPTLFLFVDGVHESWNGDRNNLMN